MPGYKEKFISIFCEKISRDGADELLGWIHTTDFFSAPASTKFHCAKEGGLVEHSVKVYEVLREKHFEPSDDEESFAICALLHDVCKINFYKVSSRNVKNEPYGHGEKSVFLIERFMRLKPAEAVAIRWHMGGFDDAVKGGGYNSPIAFAFDKYPLSVKLFIADLESTYIREKGTSAVKKHF